MPHRQDMGPGGLLGGAGHAGQAPALTILTPTPARNPGPDHYISQPYRCPVEVASAKHHMQDPRRDARDLTAQPTAPSLTPVMADSSAFPCQQDHIQELNRRSQDWLDSNVLLLQTALSSVPDVTYSKDEIMHVVGVTVVNSVSLGLGSGSGLAGMEGPMQGLCDRLALRVACEDRPDPLLCTNERSPHPLCRCCSSRCLRLRTQQSRRTRRRTAPDSSLGPTSSSTTAGLTPQSRKSRDCGRTKV